MADTVVQTRTDAPTAADQATSPPRPTTRAVWWTELGVLVALLVLQAPAAAARLRSELPTDLAERVGDEAMIDQAVRIGSIVGLVVMPLMLAVVLAIASMLERRIFPVSLELPRGQRVGAFHLTLAFCLIPPGAVAVVLGLGERPRGPLVAAFVGLVVLAVVVLFRPAWRTLPGPRATLVVVAIAAVAGLTSI